VVTAALTSTDIPYSAKLISVFEDGKTKKRRVDGHYQEKVLTDVKVTHSDPFYTHNRMPAPTTTTTTTTTSPTTTTTTPTPSTPAPTLKHTNKTGRS
jgi:hypothetical protein